MLSLFGSFIVSVGARRSYSSGANSTMGMPSIRNDFSLSRPELTRTKPSRRHAGPPFESMCQRADLAIAKQPCDFGNRQLLIVEIALGEGGPQLVQYLREGSTLLVKLARQSSRAHPEPPRNFRCHGSAVRQQFRPKVLCLRTDRKAHSGLASQRLFRVAPQQFVEAFVASYNRKQGNRSRKPDLVGVSAKFDVNAEECSEIRGRSISEMFCLQP